ncbi:MAG: protoporphyrinogen oxidase [Vampirovibrionales bacterium]|nr:protoporphyrinogen oxidase [Vampirovibrionales bacterium]
MSQQNPEAFYDAIIVGGGISGLTLAYRLKAQNKRVLLLEADTEPGGVIKSFQVQMARGKVLLEAGPNTVPTSAREFMELADAVGLLPIRSSPLAKNRYIYLAGQLVKVPGGPLSFLFSPILSLSGKLGLLRDLIQPPCSQNDPSLADFITHRFGPEVLSNLVTPAVTGIYASDPAQMSLQATFPFLAIWERQYGSVIKGAFAALKKKKQAAAKDKTKQTYALLSFEEGLQALPKALAKALQPNIRLASPVFRVEVLNKKHSEEFEYQVTLESGEQVSARSLVLATPAEVSASLLSNLQTEAAGLLKTIEYSPMHLVYLGFEKSALKKDWDGFGFLVPRNQNLQLLGSIWCSAIFPERFADTLAVSVHFQGGAFYPQLSRLSDDALIAQTLQDVQTIYRDANLMPVFSLVRRWPRAIPQYTPGHIERQQKVDALLARDCPGLYLLGNYRSGVSLNDCVKQANALAECMTLTS